MTMCTSHIIAPCSIHESLSLHQYSSTRVMLQRLLSGPPYEITLHRVWGCPPSGLKLFFPVICSAATLIHAISDYQCLIPWLRMNNPRHIPSRVILWFDCWFMLKTRGKLTLVVLTSVDGYITCRSTSGRAHQMYLYGTLFASCHLIFAPNVPLQLFLRCHTFRILTVDIPAFFFAFWKHSGMLLKQCFIIRLWFV
ncbi:hypothetical protein BKA83DRAFT_4393078, partial [Pisolithus microcarpus]